MTDDEIIIIDTGAEEGAETMEIETVSDRPFLTTSFEDYTVTEGLLLSLLLCVFVSAVYRILRRGFSWLR